MIIGIGNDLCDRRRIAQTFARFGDRFLMRVFTETERIQAADLSGTRLDAFLARRFAAKEACAKALGTGFAQGVAHNEIGVASDTLGRPGLHLTGQAAARLDALLPAGAVAHLHLSLTDESPLAAAMVVIEAV